MTRVQAGLLVLLLVPVLWGLVWWGWRGRVRRTAPPAALPAAPDVLGEPLLAPVDAVYVSTTTAGDWLDRVAAGGLGVRSEALVGVHPEGVLVARTGAPDLWLPVGALTGVRRQRGIAGKVVDAEGVVVLTWRLADAEYDTGLRPRRSADRDALHDAVRDLLEGTR
ncbi:PH-like domain-containing protein [Thalassiella azotivora]